MPSKKVPPEIIQVAGHEVSVTNPGKVLFPAAKYTKLDVVRYYLVVADGALRGAGGRPNMLVRYPNGIEDEHFYQKRAPSSRPDWIEVVSLRFPSGRSADEVVPRDAGTLAWLAVICPAWRSVWRRYTVRVSWRRSGITLPSHPTGWARPQVG